MDNCDLLIGFLDKPFAYVEVVLETDLKDLMEPNTAIFLVSHATVDIIGVPTSS